MHARRGGGEKRGLTHSPAIGSPITGGGRSAPSVLPRRRAPSARYAAATELVAALAPRLRREPWNDWREHQIGHGDVTGAWAVAVFFLTALLFASL
jgi:hypothetical protein